MACSARDVGVESIFTRGSASGDWQQRHHPSDLLYPAPLSPPSAVADEMGGGGGGADADQSNRATSAWDVHAQHTAECIAAVTARVLRQRGVDEATIADAVRVLHVARRVAIRHASYGTGTRQRHW